MARRRSIAKKVHAVKLRHAHAKVALFRQGQLKYEQLSALGRRILVKGMKAGQTQIAAPPEKAAERKEKPKAHPPSAPTTA